MNAIGNLYIGTAGWSYEDWNGIVYPPTRPRGFHELTYLAQFFNTIEINTTFYRIPAPRMSASWVRRTKDLRDFLFVTKLWQGFTHERSQLNKSDVNAFKAGIAPLDESGRLGSILMQFPWSFRFTEENFEWLTRLAEQFSEYPVTIEQRHASWLSDDYFSFLKTHRIAFCNIDQPLFQHSIPLTEHVTAPIAYMRLHGRNYKMWFKEGAGVNERYNYLYGEKELLPIVDIVRRLLRQVTRVFVITNNHWRGQAVCNAVQMSSMLRGKKVRLSQTLLDHFPTLGAIAEEKGSLSEQQLNLL
jgi:uncharacterized protein YecE (DUF72 family)